MKEPEKVGVEGGLSFRAGEPVRAELLQALADKVACRGGVQPPAVARGSGRSWSSVTPRPFELRWLSDSTGDGWVVGITGGLLWLRAGVCAVIPTLLLPDEEPMAGAWPPELAGGHVSIKSGQWVRLSVTEDDKGKVSAKLVAADEVAQDVELKEVLVG